MFWTDGKSYKSTLAILKKEAELPPVFVELKRFIEGEFGITVYNITYKPYGIFNRPKKYFFAYSKRMSLTCLVSSYEEFEKMWKRTEVEGEEIDGRVAYRISPDEQKQAIVLAKFFELAKKYDYSVGADAGKIFVDYNFSFLFDYIRSILYKIERKTRKAIMQKYKEEAGIDQISTDFFSVAVFYKTNAQKLENDENGISDMIRKEYFSAVKKVDELGFYKEEYISFDSKENLDKNYNGSTQMYFR